MISTVTEPRFCGNGDETDAFEHRGRFHWRPGEAARIKRAARRRERHAARAHLRRHPDLE